MLNDIKGIITKKGSFIYTTSISEYGSQYLIAKDKQDCCHIKIRISNHPQQDKYRGVDGGINYNLYRSIFKTEKDEIKEIEKLLLRSHKKKFNKIKPKSKWITPDKALEEYKLKELPLNLIWFKENSPLRKAILRESLINELKKIK